MYSANKASNHASASRTTDMSQGCPIPVGNNVCGEPNSLEIMKEFNRLYEERMEQVDSEAAGDCLQEKIKLQREWIRNLTQQNDMLVRAVQELEYEATERVQQLEGKLQKSAQCLCEVMKKYREHDFAADLLAEPLQNISHLEDDIKNVLEFVRRIREDRKWSLDGLFFYSISGKDLMGAQCEYSNKFTDDDSREGESKLQEKERTIQELTEKLNYYNSFGNVEDIAKELQSRRSECESLKQEMADMRHALTEEVAAKHDQLVVLRKDLQVFEERCMQADKQTAFKEDIIRELRKEVKQLKQQFAQDEVGKLNNIIEELKDNLEKTRIAQDEEETCHRNEISLLNETISSLEMKLRKLEEQYQKDIKTCKICRGRSKVGFLEHSEVQADLGESDSELMKVLNETNSKMKVDMEKRNLEIRHLKNTIKELESALKTCEERASNLQEAVALYSNSVSVLESSEEASKLQIQQQKVTITNLQQALVEAKQEVDEIRKKSQDNDTKRQEILTLLELTVKDMEEENDLIKIESEKINREYEALQDLNFTLEIEHCDSLQDMDSLDYQLKKYQYLFNVNEEQMKKLSKQKRCYEELIAYFKHEMSLMADQLNNLQELLTLSNESAQQESNKVMSAFIEVQTLNEKLSTQLCACEQKVQLENQMNQLHEAKICELQRLLTEKETDLSKHDEAILNIRKTLNDSLRQNEDLQMTIGELNETIAHLTGSVKQYEYENCATKKSCAEFQNQVGVYCDKLEELKKSLDEKTAECLKLEMAYNNEKRALKSAQKQLQETEKRQQENQKDLVNSLEDLKQKLAISDSNNGKLCQECESLQSQLANLSRKEAVKDLEIKRYRKIVGDLKATMMELNTELNKNLAQKAFKTSCKNVNCRGGDPEKNDPKLQDICLGCPCEVEFYQKMVDILKQSITELKKKLTDTEQRNQILEDEAKQKDLQINDLKKTKDELNQQLSQSHRNDKKIADLEREIDRLTQDLQVKSLQLSDVKKSANEINGSKCIQLACAQEEISSLKSELANILNREYLLKRENDDLRSQSAELHCTVNCLSEKNKMLKDQVDQYLLRIKNLNTEKETLIRKNKELLTELRTIQSMTYSSDKQQRLTAESVKQLEADIEDLKNSKFDICQESKNVIKNVRAWVAEQKKINSFVAKREQEFIQTIKQLNGSKEVPITNPRSTLSRTRTGRSNRTSGYGHLCTSPCSLGSQGTASVYDVDSPPPSPDFGVSNEWYSTTFRAESENESEDDYCVNTLENLTHQMRRSNQIWMDENKRSLKECKVTKDMKERK